jgi:predicted MFS family arabinose efflux permease
MFGYYQPYFNTLHANTVLMGATYSVIAIFSILGAHIGKKLVPRYSPYFMSSLLLWGTIITAFLMLAENQYLAFAATFVLAIPFGFSNATLRHFLNSQSPSNIKSSIASFGTTLYAAGTMLGLAAAGILADHFAPRTILMCIIAVSAVILVLNKTISQSRNASQTA